MHNSVYMLKEVSIGEELKKLIGEETHSVSSVIKSFPTSNLFFKIKFNFDIQAANRKGLFMYMKAYL